MEYLKLIASLLTLIIAVSSLLFNYKVKLRTGNPRTDREVLSGRGKIAVLLVVLSGLFSIGSEVQSLFKKPSEEEKLIQQALLQLSKTQSKQEELNMAADRWVQKIHESVAQLEQLCTDSMRLKN